MAVRTPPDWKLSERDVAAAMLPVAVTVDWTEPRCTVAVRTADGQLTPQPPAETQLRAGDMILAMGTKATLERLERLFDPTEARAPAAPA